ncbi:MAG: AAA family ATPase [Lachnospiraceae bacterium]|nr:AAA family ATPase [Lachnospiraceae bacterium]
MKLVFLIGSGAVGKMTVGQELAKITDLRLFHNHMMIEPVIDIFGYRDGQTVIELRDVIFRNFAASGQYGMIFTFMWAFDMQEDWDYIAHVKEIFEPYGTQFYYVELEAPQAIRLERNGTENRLKNKRSKQDLEASRERLLREDSKHRLESLEGEIPFENYLRLDNSALPAAEAAARIKDTFGL